MTLRVNLTAKAVNCIIVFPFVQHLANVRYLFCCLQVYL